MCGQGDGVFSKLRSLAGIFKVSLAIRVMNAYSENYPVPGNWRSPPR